MISSSVENYQIIRLGKANPETAQTDYFFVESLLVLLNLRCLIINVVIVYYFSKIITL